MNTSTATKTAVQWMVLGGVSALAASLLLGDPWQVQQNLPTANNDTNSKTVTTRKLTASCWLKDKQVSYYKTAMDPFFTAGINQWYEEQQKKCLEKGKNYVFKDYGDPLAPTR